jgi:hypothetical protein
LGENLTKQTKIANFKWSGKMWKIKIKSLYDNISSVMRINIIWVGIFHSSHMSNFNIICVEYEFYKFNRWSISTIYQCVLVNDITNNLKLFKILYVSPSKKKNHM